MHYSAQSWVKNGPKDSLQKEFSCLLYFPQIHQRPMISVVFTPIVFFSLPVGENFTPFAIKDREHGWIRTWKFQISN